VDIARDNAPPSALYPLKTARDKKFRRESGCASDHTDEGKRRGDFRWELCRGRRQKENDHPGAPKKSEAEQRKRGILPTKLLKILMTESVKRSDPGARQRTTRNLMHRNTLFSYHEIGSGKVPKLKNKSEN